MKVKTHSIKEITWILSLSPRECLGFRLLQFMSFKNKWRGKEPSFEFVKKPAPLFSTLSAYGKHPAQRWSDRISQGFKEEKILEFDFLKEESWYQDCISPRHTFSLRFAFSSPPTPHPQAPGESLHYRHHTYCCLRGRQNHPVKGQNTKREV